MGNYRFKLSDILPNAWIYKVKEMTKTRKNQEKNTTKKHKHQSIAIVEEIPNQRKSYYFTRELTLQSNSPFQTKIPDQKSPPRKSSRRRRRSTKRTGQPAKQVTSTGCSCRSTIESVWTKPQPEDYENTLYNQTSFSDHDSLLPEYGSDRGLTHDESFDRMSNTSCKCSIDHTVLDNLPPIITKKQEDQHFSSIGKLDHNKTTTITTTTSPMRRYSSSPGVKLRTNSPRISNRRINQGRKSTSNSSSARRSVSESFAVVKSSKDPRRDFWDSMVEMIVENNIRESKDLEALLACYLSLNSDEYHGLIINVFKQIWFDFIHVEIK